MRGIDCRGQTGDYLCMASATDEQLQAARVFAAETERDIAAHAFDEDFGFASHVTAAEKSEYVEEQIKLAEQIEAGELDHNFTVAQRMHYYLTGDCVALLPGEN